jgi:cell division transport system permease protein
MPRLDGDTKNVSLLTALLLLSLIILPFGLTTLVVQNLRDYEQSLRSRLRFEIYLRDQTTPEQVQLLITQLKTLEGFVQFSYRDKTDVFEQMQTALGTQLLPDDATNPFPSVVEIAFTPPYSNLANFNLIEIVLRKFPFVEEVNYGADWLTAHEKTFSSAEQILSALRTITSVCTFLLMFWFMRRIILSREQYYTILRRLGAGWRMMAIPFILRKTVLGMAAAALSLVALYGCFRLVTGWQIDVTFVTAANMSIVLGFGGIVALLSATLAIGREI